MIVAALQRGRVKLLLCPHSFWDTLVACQKRVHDMEDTASRLVGSSRVMTHTELPAPCSSSSSLHTTAEDGCRLLPTSSPGRVRARLPPLSRFLADFTLGFADGLTVPFALTAGLSSLGETQTVIYAGMAEICAGSISSTYIEALSSISTSRASDYPDGMRRSTSNSHESGRAGAN